MPMNTESWIEDFHGDLMVSTLVIAMMCGVDHRLILLTVHCLDRNRLGPVAWEYPRRADSVARLTEKQAVMVIEKQKSTKDVLRFKHGLLKDFRRARELLGKAEEEAEAAELDSAFRARLNAIRKQRPNSKTGAAYGESIAAVTEAVLDLLRQKRGGKPLSSRQILSLVEASRNLIEAGRLAGAPVRRWKRLAKRPTGWERAALRRSEDGALQNAGAMAAFGDTPACSG
jgi:hypothetical protein